MVSHAHPRQRNVQTLPRHLVQMKQVFENRQNYSVYGLALYANTRMQKEKWVTEVELQANKAKGTQAASARTQTVRCECLVLRTHLGLVNGHGKRRLYRKVVFHIDL